MDGAEPSWVARAHMLGTVALEEWEEAEVNEDDGGPDGPPVDHDGEAFYEGDDWH